MQFDLITALALTGFAVFAASLLVNLRWMIRQVRRLTVPLAALVGAWTLMFVAKISFVDWRGGIRDEIGGVGAMDGSAFHQVICTAGAAALVCLLLISMRKASRALQRPVVLLLLAYGAIAMLSTTYSPAPALTAFKASLLLVDAALLLIALTMLGDRGEAMALLDSCYFVAYLFSAGALLGAILAPDFAFLQQYGALSEKRLQGLLPAMHPNEIGALAAISAIVGFVRTFGSIPGTRRRSYWAAQLVVGLTVVFLAQARTSLIGLVLGAGLAALTIPRLRRYVGMAAVAAVVAAVFSVVHSGSVDWHEGPMKVITAYFQRGEELSNLSDVEDFHGRLDDWRAGLRMIEDSPVVGHGYDAGVRELGHSYGVSAPHMHNAHLQVLVNTGIAGYLPWVCLVLLASWTTFTPLLRPRSFGSEQSHIDAVETAAVLVGVLITTMTFSELAAHTQTFMLMLGIVIYQQVARSDARSPVRQRTIAAYPRIRVGSPVGTTAWRRS